MDTSLSIGQRVKDYCESDGPGYLGLRKEPQGWECMWRATAMSGRIRMESAIKDIESKVKLPLLKYSVNHLPRVGLLSNTE